MIPVEKIAKETDSKVLPDSGTCSLVVPSGSGHHKLDQKQHKFEFPWDIPLHEESPPLPQAQEDIVLPYASAEPIAINGNHSANNITSKVTHYKHFTLDQIKFRNTN